MTKNLWIIGIFCLSNLAHAGVLQLYHPTPAMLEEGKKLFQENCIGCHGERGDGTGAAAGALPIKPRNFLEDRFKYGNTPSKIVETIALGRNDFMPGFKDAFTDKELWAVAHFVWQKVPKKNRKTDTPATLKNWKRP